MNMKNQSTTPPPPADLGPRGSAFWTASQTDLEFDTRETALLLEVCRTLDTIDALATSVQLDGVMLVGSQGQQVLNAAVGELRQQQAAYARLVTQLNLDGAEGVPMKSPRAASASLTARRRWQNREEA
jgi:hypothetical protein